MEWADKLNEEAHNEMDNKNFTVIGSAADLVKLFV